MKKIITIASFLIPPVLFAQSSLPWLKVSANNRFFQTADGDPFFWLGDTGWLLFVKCSREEAVHYLDVRQQQGFNVVQVMVLHTLGAKNTYGDPALVNKDLSTPYTTPGNDFTDSAAYDFWDHVDFVVREAANRGIYMAMVPVWGSNIKSGRVNTEQAAAYGKFIAQRYKDYSNIIWLNGGDINGMDGMDIWKTLGKTIRENDPRHLMTFHPRGRYSSTDWFHREPWLDFNMVQSGHKDYSQDTVATEKHHYGEDNWKYIQADYALQPAKPVLDGEPSYENIPHGLHDSLQPRWTAADIRRYGYWSVFAGAAGYTYGENAVMQFNKKGNADANFGVTGNWNKTIEATGAGQVHFLKQLILSKAYFERVPAQEIIAGNNGRGYEYILATKGKTWAMAYTYTGRNFKIDLSRLGFAASGASWFSPSTGATTKLAWKNTNGVANFDPPGDAANGNDWVLILEK